jgi:hypothetical protein
VIVMIGRYHAQCYALANTRSIELNRGASIRNHGSQSSRERKRVRFVIASAMVYGPARADRLGLD